MNKNIKFFLTSFILSLFFFLGINSFQVRVERFFYAQITQPFQNLALVDLSNIPEKPRPDIEAESVISVKINKSGKERFLLRRKIDEPLSIASLTKLMTALVVIENNPDLSKTITISRDAENKYNVPIYGNLKTGQKVSLENLLNLMLHYSSNDAAFALAESVGLNNFIEKMNQKAKDLGLENTHFINPTGLDPQDIDTVPNYSTSYDLMLLSKYILKNHPFLFELSLENGPYLIENGVLDLHILDSQIIIGGKTGYTEKAGGCMLFVFSDQNENYFINLVLGTESPQKRIEEMQKLINWINL
ncbi:MAG: D-alanyl-D-alanine carboxypeptidase family protein [Candidatus Nealsonbacteria bacterium]